MDAVNGKLGLVIGNFGAMIKQQFSVIIDKLLFSEKEQIAVFNRPGVAGAVLQTALSLSESVILFPQIT